MYDIYLHFVHLTDIVCYPRNKSDIGELTFFISLNQSSYARICNSEIFGSNVTACVWLKSYSIFSAEFFSTDLKVDFASDSYFKAGLLYDWLATFRDETILA